jgi:hypothetical protein
LRRNYFANTSVAEFARGTKVVIKNHNTLIIILIAVLTINTLASHRRAGTDYLASSCIRITSLCTIAEIAVVTVCIACATGCNLFAFTYVSVAEFAYSTMSIIWYSWTSIIFLITASILNATNNSCWAN